MKSSNQRPSRAQDQATSSKVRASNWESGSESPATWTTLSENRNVKAATRIMDCCGFRTSRSETRKMHAATAPIMGLRGSQLQLEPARCYYLRGEPRGTASTANRERSGQAAIRDDAGQ